MRCGRGLQRHRVPALVAARCLTWHSARQHQDLIALPLRHCGTVKLLTLRGQIINFHYYHLFFFFFIKKKDCSVAVQFTDESRVLNLPFGDEGSSSPFLACRICLWVWGSKPCKENLYGIISVPSERCPFVSCQLSLLHSKWVMQWRSSCWISN